MQLVCVHIYTGNSCIHCVVFSTCSELVIIGILPILLQDTAGPLGAVVLHGYTISKASSDLKKPYSFKAIKGGARTYYFAGDSDEEMKR